MTVVSPSRHPVATPRLGALVGSLCALSTGLGLAGVVFVALGGDWVRYVASRQAEAAWIAAVGSFLGALMIRHRPRNPVGWLFLVNAFFYGLRNLLEQFAVQQLASRSGADPLASLASWLALPPLVISAATLDLIILFFPDGVPASAGGRRLVKVIALVTATAVCAVAVVSWPFRGRALLDDAGPPPGPRGHAFVAVTGLSQALLAALAVTALATLIARYRHAEGTERQQLRWFALGAVPSVTLIIGYHFMTGLLGGAVAVLASLPLLVGITVAVLRYRLYDIDRLISRTVSYLALSVALAGVFVTAATLLGRVLGTAGGGSTLATVGASVVATAAFQPLRHGLQQEADRRFQRRSYDATAVIGRYLDDLQERDYLPGALTRSLALALADPTVEVGLWLGRYNRYVTEQGYDLTLPAEGTTDRMVTRVNRGQEHLGVLLHRPSLVDDAPQVLAAVTRAAGLAFDHARLGAQGLVQVQEVRESRARILAAGDAQRRRVERDLHDGAQQRLVALELTLRRLRAQAQAAGAGSLSADLESTAQEVHSALVELRELSRGLIPPILAERGLLAAVTSLAERTHLPTQVLSDVDRRYPQPIETAAYYVVAEALANVTKHADAGRVTVTVNHRPTGLAVCVDDDGVGGAMADNGSGLSGLLDRIEAVGGQLSIDSPPGHGTRILAELPA